MEGASSPVIRSTAVLGAGTMGAQIAAHFANAGFRVLLLDVSREAAREGLDRSRKLKPDPFFTADIVGRIRIGSFDEDLPQLAGADWIVEAIVEQAGIKRDLLGRVDAVRRPGSIVSSNTSGLSIARLAEGRSEDFRAHWLGTHFFNPPRYLPLLELIPTADTAPAVLAAVSDFAERRLGKNIVIAKDAPGFIANHVAVHGVVRILHELASARYTVEEIDAIMGPALGRPKSATFRTLDIVGLDVFLHVATNLAERLVRAEDRRVFELPPFFRDMVARGWIGEKTGRGFYQRKISESGAPEIWALDPTTMEYRPRRPVALPSLEAAQTATDPADRVRRLFLGHDRVGEFLRASLAPSLVYTARVAPEIAHSIDDVDRAIRWGYGWAQGPFELWDAIGFTEVLSAASESSPPPLVSDLIAAGHRRFHATPLPPASAELELLRAAREGERMVKRNAGASLLDLGDGVLAVALHSKMNAIGEDAIEMLESGIKEASRSFSALVIGTEAPNFSAGANLMLLLLEVQDGHWEEIDSMVRTFQRVTTGLRYAEVPVIVAAGGLTLGGGCELMLHADRTQAAAETYTGLVEVGVGLIPAAGGTKEMLCRSLAGRPDGQTDLLPFVQRAFETIAFAKVSTSAAHAVELGYLRDHDGITMNRDRLTHDAKLLALSRVRDGYRPPAPPTSIPVGGDGVRAALDLGVHLAWRAGRISDYDALIGRKLAWVLSGGSLPHASTVNEQYLLDLEREAFLSLCGESKTLERIQHTLKTGTTLRN